MIKVSFQDNDGVLSLRVWDHGETMVCTASSALIGTLDAILERMEESFMLDGEIRTHEEEGNSCVECRPYSWTTAEVLLAFHTIQAGYLALSEEYPNDIQVVDEMDWPF